MALFYGDSFLRPEFISDTVKVFVENRLNLSVRFIGNSGCTSNQLIGEKGSIHSELKKSDNALVFLSIGQNDISKIDLSEYSEAVAAHAFATSFSEKVCCLSVKYPDKKFVVMPITLRNLGNRSPSAVARANGVIKGIFSSEITCNCHPSNILFVNPNFIHSAHGHKTLTVSDGVHLNLDGKKLWMHTTISQFLKKF